jgi:hypothetical protein
MLRVILLTLLTMLTIGSPLGHAPQAVATPLDAIMLKVTTPTGRAATITVPEGGRATVGLKNGRTLALEPSRAADGRLAVVISAKEIDPNTGAESWLVVDRLSLALRQPARFEDAMFPIGLEWDGVRSQTAAAGTTGEPCQRCCVVCGGEVICACRVQAPCGECCCASTCSCDIIG